MKNYRIVLKVMVSLFALGLLSSCEDSDETEHVDAVRKTSLWHLA